MLRQSIAGIVARLVVGQILLAAILTGGTPSLGLNTMLAESSGPEMALSVTGGEAWFCFDTDCYAETDSSFELTVEVVEAPGDGYVLFQTAIDFGIYDPTASGDGAGANTCGDGVDNTYPYDGWDRRDDDCIESGLTYEATENTADEILWEDESDLVVRGEIAAGLLNHGGITAFILPLPVSTYEGPIVVVDMSCPSSPNEVDVKLLPFGDEFVQQDGAVFVDDDGVVTIPKLAGITVHCVTKQSDPGDTDEDGCADVAENGNDETEGGLRDYLNPWDFYDVSGDGYIALFTDILPVTSRYGLEEGDPGYDEIYDRGPVPEGGDPWDMTAPDGVINMTDINGVYAQYQHRC